MKVLIATVPYYPIVGGVSVVSHLLAGSLASLGHSVRLVTLTPSEGPDAPEPFLVVRQPGFGALLGAYQWCDAVILQGVSTQLGWPLLLTSKPCLVMHHIPAPSRAEEGIFSSRLRRMLWRRGKHFACSTYLANQIGPFCGVLPNPYDDQMFALDASQSRSLDIIFIGRLIPEKGLSLLLDALRLLATRDLGPTLTVIGDGPQRGEMEALARENKRVSFLGWRTGAELGRLLNRHRVLVIPSVGHESFGIVALEGLACGCAVVASSAGGLPEAVGCCGTIFPTGDPAALANTLASLLDSLAQAEPNAAQIQDHLSHHTPQVVARTYEQALRNLR